jgi:undecaprenyl phosphate N,N'-diacetylbacillosamine 1-phosphate transferase
MYVRIFKRLLDIVLSLTGLLLLFPVLMVVTMALFLVNGGKPFFFQLRPGKNEKLFRIIKFRTMSDRRNAHGTLLPDEKRTTAVGNILRKTSFDEVPQLVNVLLGHMSLVGPRPLLPEYLPLYNDQQRKRHRVRPGITGWAQVNGRNAITWNQKFDLDNWYVNHISFPLDCKILWLTIRKLFSPRDVNFTQPSATARFQGNDE